MKLIFENTERKRRKIADKVIDEGQAILLIKKFCKERNYKIPYIRMIDGGNYKQFDVGSWTEFFYLEE